MTDRDRDKPSADEATKTQQSARRGADSAPAAADPFGGFSRIEDLRQQACNRSTDPASIVLVDDSEDNIDILLGLLADYQVQVSLDGPTALEILSRTAPDIILLDVIMPGMDGFEVCRRIRENQEFDDIPILFITARNDEASIVRGFEIGANDYVTRPFRCAELLARVRSQIRYKRAIERLKYIAVTDELTGIPNRRAFFTRGQELFATSRSKGHGLSALMMDLDHFKLINDTYGHAVGDEALRRFARLLDAQIENGDLLGRLGGEEFAIIPLRRHGAPALERAENIRAAVEAAEERIGSHLVHFTVSIGVAHTHARTDSFDALLSAADMNLYVAKQRGRNCVHHDGIAGDFPTDAFRPRIRLRKQAD